MNGTIQQQKNLGNPCNIKLGKRKRSYLNKINYLTLKNQITLVMNLSCQSPLEVEHLKTTSLHTNLKKNVRLQKTHLLQKKKYCNQLKINQRIHPN